MGTTEGLGAGDRIGDYIIDDAVGDGFEALHVVLPRRARLSIADTPESSMRLMREACILEALHHPGVPRIFEVGVLTGGRHRPWVVSELVRGTSLADDALESRRVRIHDVLELLRAVGEILAYAHSRGVAHRGVRPDAIVRDDGSRGFAVCLTNWSGAAAPDAEESDRMFADDVFALGLVADLLLGARTNAPAKLLALVDDMLGPDPFARPWAVEVAARAKLLADELDAITDDDILDVVAQGSLTAIPQQPGPRATLPPPIPTRARARWTPAIGVHPAPAQGVVVGVIPPRTTT